MTNNNDTCWRSQFHALITRHPELARPLAAATGRTPMFRAFVRELQQVINAAQLLACASRFDDDQLCMLVCLANSWLGQ